METIVTKNNFEEEVMSGGKPVLIDFYATWCGPCNMLAPVIHDISENNDKVKVCKVNVDEEMELAMKYGVQSIPLLVLIKDGKIAKKMAGYHSREEVEDMITKYV